MGILGGLLQVVAKMIDTVASKLPVVDIPNFSSSIAYMNSILSIVNAIFPLNVCGLVLGIQASFFVAMLIFYFIQRAINLIRGAG